jgi:hypothetical protein
VAFANTCVTLERLRLSSGRPIAPCAQRNLRRPSRHPLHGERQVIAGAYHKRGDKPSSSSALGAPSDTPMARRHDRRSVGNEIGACAIACSVTDTKRFLSRYLLTKSISRRSRRSCNRWCTRSCCSHTHHIHSHSRVFDTHVDVDRAIHLTKRSVLWRYCVTGHGRELLSAHGANRNIGRTPLTRATDLNSTYCPVAELDALALRRPKPETTPR